MRFKLLLVLLSLATVTVSCDRNVAITSTNTASVSTVSATPESTVTATLQTTDTAIPPRTEPTSTISSPDPIYFPTVLSPTPIPEPLNQNGPWLLLSQDTMFTGPGGRVIGPVFSNKDGAAWQPVNLPQVTPFMEEFRDWWFVYNSKVGPYIAFQNYDLALDPKCSTDAGRDERPNLLVIFKLPENRTVRQFQLFGNQSIEKIRTDECISQSDNNRLKSPVLGVVASGSNTEWSPDGRYLAFVAAPDQPDADLYLYDTQTDQLRRLTSRQNNPQILGWSPDGQTIIYMSVTKMQYDRPNILESSGLYAVSISGTDQLLDNGNSVYGDLQWLSKSHFVITDGICNVWANDTCKGQVLLFDLSTSKSEVIYNKDLILFSYSADPIHHLLLIWNPPLPGLYYFNLETRSVRPVPVDETLPFPYWDANLQAFRDDDWYSDPTNTLHTTLLRYTTADGFIVEKIDNIPDPSLDGMWNVITEDGKKFIKDAQGKTIQKLEDGGGCGWSPDSSTYSQLIPKPGEPYATWFMLYKKENNWQPILIRKITEGGDWWCTWIRP